MTEDSVVALHHPGVTADPLTEVLRAGARELLARLCCKPDVGVSQIRTTTVLSSCFCVGQTVL